MSILFYSASGTQEIGGIDSYTKLMLHMDSGDASDSQHVVNSFGDPVFDNSNKKFNSSVAFDGNGDYLIVPSDASLVFGSSDFTIDFWYRSSAPSNSTAFMCKRSSVAHYRSFILAISSEGKLAVIMDSGSVGPWEINSSGPTPITANVWHHIALVRNGTSVKAYLDGSEEVSETFSGSLSDDGAALRIGSDADVNFLLGNMDEIRISDTARWTSDFSGSLPTEEYTSDANTVLLMHVDGDVSDSDHDIIMASSPGWDAGNYKFPTSSVYFDNADYLAIADHEDWNLGSEDFTIDFWMRLPVLPSTQYFGLFGQRYNFDNACSISAVYQDVGGNAIGLAFNNYAVNHQFSWTPTINTWYHIAWVRNGNDLYLFIDGDLKDTADVTGLTVADSGQQLTIGNLFAAGLGIYPLNGWMDEFRWSKGTARWTSNFIPKTGPYTT
jgi:hypothetical protein